MPQVLAANRKYDKIRDDIKSIVEIAQTYNASVRYILEYRKFDHFCLKKACEIFENMGIKYVRERRPSWEVEVELKKAVKSLDN